MRASKLPRVHSKYVGAAPPGATSVGLQWLPGELVTLENLSRFPHLHGRTFAVIRYVPSTNRYVLVDSDDGVQYYAKPENVRQLGELDARGPDDETAPATDQEVAQFAQKHHGRSELNTAGYFLRAMRRMGADENWLSLSLRLRRFGEQWIRDDVMYYVSLRMNGDISEDTLLELLDQELQHVTTI